MTPIILLDDLQKFIEENTKDILLEVKVRTGPATEKERAAKVYKLGLPEKDDNTQQIPYILLKVLTGADEKEENQPKSSEVRVRMIIATYSQDGQQGQLALLNLILRIRERLQKQHIIGGRFCLEYPFEYIIYQDTTPPLLHGGNHDNMEHTEYRKRGAGNMAVKKNATAAAESEKAAGVDKSTIEAEKAGNGAQTQLQTADNEPDTVKLIYIGPSLPKAMLKSNSIFEGTREEIKKELEAVLEKFPLVEKLLVPVAGLAEKKDKVRTAGNILNKYYSDIASAASAMLGKEV